MSDHQRDLAKAFDGQAEQFERAPVQSDPAALSRLVAFAGFAKGSRLLDAGCGPGLVAEAFLGTGCQVHGVDLSLEMVRRARQRCQRFGASARFEVGEVETLEAGPFDGAVSRFVVHHAPEPLTFLRAQLARVRPGGRVVVCDHTSDPDPGKAAWHNEVERARDRTHTRTLSPGELVDLCARAGLAKLRMAEEAYELDFDEWFDRGTPGRGKDEVRRMSEQGRARGFDPVARPDGGLTFLSFRQLVCGERGRAPEG
jgi:ubiquinone/menaquinone biosynthesis C-methylase UbiE